MKASSMFHCRVATMLCVFLLTHELTAQDQTVTGNLTVTGSIASGGPIDSNDNTFSFGTQGSSFGGALVYQDDSADTFTFMINRSPASWLWLHTAGVAAMRLDASHQLILYQSDGTTAGLILSPAGNSIKLGAHASATLTADSNGVITAGGGFAVAGGIANTNGTLSGGPTGLVLNAGGTDQSINLNPSGSGDVRIAASANGGEVILGNADVITYAGHFRPHGHDSFDLGLSGQRWRSSYVHGLTATGSLVVDSGSISGGAAGLNLAAGDADQSVTLSADGTGLVVLEAPLRVVTTASGLARFARAGTTPDGVGLLIAANDSGPSFETLEAHNLRFIINGSEAGRIAANGNLLLGATADEDNGRLQIASHTTAAGGVGFGTDTNLYRSAAGTLKTDGKLVAASARFDGVVRIAPQGDLSMGEFTSEPQ